MDMDTIRKGVQVVVVTEEDDPRDREMEMEMEMDDPWCLPPIAAEERSVRKRG